MNNENKLLLLAVVVIVGALLYYCFNTGSKSEDVSAAAGETYKLEYTPTLKTYGFTEPVVLKAKPQRVVSLVHTPVLALHEMGIKQVAVPQAAMLEWPADLVKDAKLLNVSMNSNFDIESVIALEPDLVIVGYQSKDTYGKILDREKIPVYYVDAGHVVSYESIKELTDVLIKAFGQHNAGAEAITDRFNKLEARMAEKRQENKGQKVMVLQSAPPRHYIQGKDGTLGSMLNMLGYENVYQNNKMVLIDLEQALSYEPDLLFCVGGSKTAAEHQQVMEEDFAKNPEYWNNIKAIREREVIYLPIKYVATAGINVIDNINELIDIIDAKKLKQMGKEVNVLRVSMVCLVLVAVLLLLAVVALGVGSAGYSLQQIIQALFYDESGPVRVVVYNLRLPRLIMAVEVGACLAVAGALLQAVMRNPLADPGIIGVSAGAATAATTILLLFPTLVSSVPLFAFGGAALACVLIYLLAWRDGIDTVRIILSGVAINTVLGAYNSFLQLLNSDNLSSVLSFMNGSLSGRSWDHVYIITVYAFIGLVLGVCCIKNANILQLGDEMAQSLGVNVTFVRIFLSAVAAFWQLRR